MITKIAFVGQMFSGKTAAASVLSRERGFVRLSFADPVKIVAASMMEQLNSYVTLYDVPSQKWNYATIHDRKHQPQIRKLLQMVGQELGRELYDEDVWVNVLVQSAEQLPRVVIDDCRYLNEADKLREDGYKIVRIVRPEPLRLQMLQEFYPDNWQEIMEHDSENELKDYEVDAILYAKDLDNLRENVLNYIQSDELDD